MNKPRMKCKRGHEYNLRNAVYRANGKRSCQVCNRLMGTLRYRNDPEYRSKKLTQAKEYRALIRHSKISKPETESARSNIHD